MHAPLMLLHALLWLADQSRGHGLLEDGACCTVYCIGARKEAQQWPVFLELGALLPRVHLHLVFAGPEIPRALDGRSALFATLFATACGVAGCSCSRAGQCAAAGEAASSCDADELGPDNVARGSVRLSFARGLYHDVGDRLARDLGAAHLVFGPNAGLAAYPSWLPMLQRLALPGAPPCVFTDFCEEAALRTAEAAAACFGASKPGGDAAGRGWHVSGVQVNPFRQPLSCQGADNALPSYSNGFVFYVD